jgi:hypothetical protein
VKEYFKNIWIMYPYRTVMVIALTVRLIAAVFAKGYGMHDDHFCVIEVAQNWVNGVALPDAKDPSLRNLFYIGLHYLLFNGIEQIGIFDPQIKMYIVRILHALYSLLIVWFGMKITEELSDKHNAKFAGILLALFWVLPFMSVRNLVEIVCIPPLMIVTYLLIKKNQNKELLLAVLAGAASGIAFVLRYQTASFIGLLGLLLLIERKWTRLIGLIIGFIVISFIVLGIPEYYVYGKPFTTLIEYLHYNADSKNMYEYTTNSWYTYAGTVLGFLIPPTSLMIFATFLMAWKKARYLVFPTVAFLIFHSLYPNKQERFIFPIFPFILIGSMIGWFWLKKVMKVSLRWDRINKWMWGWFWVVNVFLLIITLFTYSKKTRVESMRFFYDKPEVKAILMNDELSSIPMMPFFYMGRTCQIYEISREKPLDSLKINFNNGNSLMPAYIIYLGEDHLQERIDKLKLLFPSQKLVKQIDPSFVDNLLYRLNPRYNINRAVYIYRVLDYK